MKVLVPRIDHPEIVVGFVAPIGAEIDGTIAAFHSYFKDRGYSVIELRATDVFQVLKNYVKPDIELSTKTPQDRYKSHISYGDQLRRYFQDDSLLAAASIARVIAKRETLNQKRKSAATDMYAKTVFLLRQFKRREEIDLLRATYGEIFFQVSVYSRRGARVDNLARKFASGHHSATANPYRAPAEEIVQRDESESGDHGQQVAKIFPGADFIVNLDQHDPSPEKQVVRFCDLLFSSNCLSPTKMEHGMFLAKGAALRSLDLSRQVGACVLDDEGQIICLGANEVPKAGGGTYWADGAQDDRDYRRGSDSNEKRKREILSDLLTALKHPHPVDDVMKEPAVRETQLMDALEYTRVIHAEMNALTDAARQGRSIKGATLYVTTYPCHMCSKHVIASGISKVVFLEPYPKSLTSQLHSDSAEIEGGDRGNYSKFPSVEFAHFFGVTPRRYQLLFERSRRKKDDGDFVQFRNGVQQPLIDIKAPFYVQTESIVLKALQQLYTGKLGGIGDTLASTDPE